MTNAEKIRQMSDEELADLLTEHANMIAGMLPYTRIMEDYRDGALGWLKREETE